MMKKAKSCGGIIFRKEGDSVKYLLVKHRESGGGHWDLAKGHVEEGESDEETALREIYEETGLNVKIIEGFKESISYIDNVNSEDKTVFFFLCEADTSEVKLDHDEVIDYVWLSFEEALEKITYDNAKGLLKKADSFIKQSKS